MGWTALGGLRNEGGIVRLSCRGRQELVATELVSGNMRRRGRHDMGAFGYHGILPRCCAGTLKKKHCEILCTYYYGIPIRNRTITTTTTPSHGIGVSTPEPCSTRLLTVKVWMESRSVPLINPFSRFRYPVPAAVLA